MLNLNRNVLKMIAAVSMFVDHLGYEIFPEVQLFRIIGRLAFPIFAYFIFEGCKYTRNKYRYFGQLFGVGVLCMLGYYWYSGEIYGNILITFSLSVMNISCISYLYQRFEKALTLKNGIGIILGTVLSLLVTFFICNVIFIDYGFFGVMVPVITAIFDLLSSKGRKHLSIIGFCIGLLLLAIEAGGIQYLSLAAVFLLLMYNGEKGKYPMKYFFYLYYPLHLLAIESIAILI